MSIILKHRMTYVIFLFIILYVVAVVCSSRDCIEKCSCNIRQDKLIDVDCSHESLTFVPTRLPDGLGSLDLSYNSITLPWTGPILECKNLTMLDVSYNQISELKPLLTHAKSYTSLNVTNIIHSLEELNLSNNLIKSIDKDIFSVFQQLLVLDLSGNCLTKFGLNERSFSGLSLLQVLNLTHNNIGLCEHSYPNKIFRDLKSLRTLAINQNTYGVRDKKCNLISSIYNCENSYPDKAISNLITLKEVFIDLLPYSVIFEVGFRKLTKLQHLYLQSSSVEEEVNRVSINLFLNIITTVPLNITFDSQISIYFEPGVFDNLYTLQTLRFKGVFNGMENVSDTFSNLQSLQLKELEISYIRCKDYCKLTSDWVRYIKNYPLETLIMEHNNLIDADPGFLARLPKSVSKISLAFNKFLKLNLLLGFYWMTNLKVLDFSSQFKYATANNMKNKMNDSLSFNDSMVRKNKEIALQIFKEQELYCKIYSKLRSVGLYEQELGTYKHEYLMQLEKRLKWGENITGLTRLPITPNNSFSLPRNLQKLYVSNTTQEFPITIAHFGYNVLVYADISSNNAWCLEGPVTGVHKLEVLDLSNNNCFALSPHFFSDFPLLKRILLSNNIIGISLEQDNHGQTFSKLNSLEYLDISQNNIRTISYNGFLGSPNLQTLNISRNAIPDFHVHIKHLRNLTLIDLSSNDLERLSVETMKSLDEIYNFNFNLAIDLYKNNLVCDCDNADFINWFLSTKVHFRNKKFYTCQYVNGSVINMNKLIDLAEKTWRFCVGRQLFLPAIITFLIIVIIMVGYSVYYYYRIRLLFYIYVSKSRFFYNFSNPENQQVKDVFIVYDEENPGWRKFVSKKVKPKLEAKRVSTFISEIDSKVGKPYRMVVEESVLAARKTLVLLTSELFESDYHELEVNMAKLAEEMMPSKTVLFLKMEPITDAYIPEHILRTMDNSCINYDEDDPKFWDNLVNILKS